jgi:hypothetical protein
VEDGHDDDSPGLDLVVDQLREPPYGGAADILEDARVQPRPFDNQVQHNLHPRGEVNPESGSLMLVPVERLVEIGPSFDPQGER